MNPIANSNNNPNSCTNVPRPTKPGLPRSTQYLAKVINPLKPPSNTRCKWTQKRNKGPTPAMRHIVCSTNHTYKRYQCRNSSTYPKAPNTSRYSPDRMAYPSPNPWLAVGATTQNASYSLNSAKKMSILSNGRPVLRRRPPKAVNKYPANMYRTSIATPNNTTGAHNAIMRPRYSPVAPI